MKRPQDAAEAERLRADFVGVILTRSPRKVSPAEALRVFDAAPSLRKVGVIGGGGVASIARTARSLELDVLQLHGPFDAGDISRLRDQFDGDIWAVAPVEENSGTIAEAWKAVADAADALLLDTGIGARTGGTGRTFNWKNAQPAVKKISRAIPVVLAGGLTPRNVGVAVRTFRPLVVDVSSGVESAPGVKDHALMQAFANAARSASIV